MRNYSKILLLAIAFFPAIAGAVDFKGLIGTVIDQLNILPGFFIGLAILFLIWNILGYIQAGDPKKRGDAQSMITYSIIAIFVMISVWGLVNILIETFDLSTGPISPPSIPGVR